MAIAYVGSLKKLLKIKKIIVKKKSISKDELKIKLIIGILNIVYVSMYLGIILTLFILINTHILLLNIGT